MAEIIEEPSALSKIIPVSFKINDTDSVATTRLATKKQFNTTDTDAWLSFTLDGIDANMTGEFDLTMVNVDENPSSIINRTNLPFSAIPFHYKIDASADVEKNQIRHAGRWIGQVIIRLANGDTTTRQFDFAIVGHLLDGKEARLILIEDYNALMATISESKQALDQYNVDYAALLDDITDAEVLRVQEYNALLAAQQANIEAFDVALDQGIVAENLAEKLQNFEATNNSRLLSAERQLEQAATKDELSQVASPLVASLAAQMTDTTRVYVYAGSEVGYTAGNWYYYNGTTWVDGGIYQATGIADKSVTIDKLGGFDEYIVPKTLAQDTGAFTGHIVTVSSTFKGWALPFLKSNFTGTITKLKVFLSVSASSEIELGIANSFASPLFTTTQTVSASGEIEFDVDLDTSLLNATFYIYFKNISGTGLRFSSATQGDYPTLANYTFYYWSGTTWITSTGFATYAIADIKVYTDYSLDYALRNHTHQPSDLVGNAVALSLPDKYDLVVGDKFELFYKGVILANDPYQYNIKTESTKGKALKRKFEYTPISADIGTQSVTISLIDDNETLLDTKTVNLIVRAKAVSPVTQKNILLIGDSLISGGEFVNEAYRRLTQTGGTPSGDGLTNIKFVGNRRTALNAGYEGFGGWVYSNYYTNATSNNIFWVTTTHDKTIEDQHSIYKDTNNVEWRLETIEAGRIKVVRVSASGTLATSGTLSWVSGGLNNSNIVYTATEPESGNPFWNETTGAVDFLNYAAEQNVSQIDICYILLGWNMSYLNEATFKAEAKYLIDKMKADYPDMQIVLLGLEVPDIDGLGTNYGATWNYYDKLKFVFNVNQWYTDIAQDYVGVEFVNVAGQFDTEYNMQKNDYYANTRTTVLEKRGNNGVHPALEGYMQIADIVYRNATGKI